MSTDLSKNGSVVAVSISPTHSFVKNMQEEVNLIAGVGVEGDAHASETVVMRPWTKEPPDAPNIRQVHLIHEELFVELEDKGYTVAPGQLGENITTRGIDLMDLPAGARLKIGSGAVIELTGKRTPCYQINDFQDGLMYAVIEKQKGKKPVFKSGVLGVVLFGGAVKKGDAITIELPEQPHKPLKPI